MEWILNMNIAVCIAVPFIVAARKILIYRVPGGTWLLLWKVLLVRLLCPFKFTPRLKNIDISETSAGILQSREKVEWAFGGLLLTSANGTLKFIWLIGAIVIAGVLISSHLVRRRLYRMALPMKGVYIEKWKETHSLKRKVEIKKSDRIAAPLTYGLIKPVILLPAYGNMDEKSIGLVLEHEFVHIKHLDILLKWILVSVCAFYWYNPLIWVMYFFVNRDIELSCDEALLKRKAAGYKREYLKLLVDLEEKKVNGDILCGSFSKYPIEERIKVMVRTEKAKAKGILLPLLVACLFVILNIGITAKAGLAYSYDGGKNPAVKCNEGAGEVPVIIGYHEESVYEILLEHGLAYLKK